jgi:anaerobic dimethyl sulfoxide reductase subunit A
MFEALGSSMLTRRSFVKWSAALGGAAALAGKVSTGLRAAGPEAEPAQTAGKWVTVACWHNCGGRCVNKAYLVDGVVTKQKTDDTHADSPDFPQMRGCARGRSQRHQIYGVDRLKYPMKRKNWAPGGGDKSLRGRDEWVRISWDEALDILASELKRVKETYGNKAIMGTSGGVSPLIRLYGGGIPVYGQSSFGGFPEVLRNMANIPDSDYIGANDRLDYKNSKLIVIFGSNPAWSAGGAPAWNYLNAKRNGAKIIIVTPQWNESCQALADQWIPVRPSTDTALLLGMAHYMITNALQDQDFLDKCTVGFDKDHMPAGADPKENFKDYVLGTYDGTPKTPEWASEICGTDPALIRQLANEMATTKPAVITTSCAPARTYLGEQYCQAFLTVGWMTGNVGRPGSRVEVSRARNITYGPTQYIRAGGSGVAGIANPFPGSSFGVVDTAAKDLYIVCFSEQWNAILTGEFTNPGTGKTKCDFRMIWEFPGGTSGNDLNQNPDTVKGIKAHRTKLEFVASADFVLSTRSKYADVVLPVATPWELEGGGLAQMARGEAITYFDQVTPPLYESRDETWIEAEVAKRLGLDATKIMPFSRKQMGFNQIAGATVMKDDGVTYEPLVTITDQDLKDWGVTGKAQQGRITLSEFRDKGTYQIERKPGDKLGFISFKDFRDDPVKNALKTKTGKLEIHCQPLADKIKAYGFTTLAPVAKYKAPLEGYEDTFSDWKNKVKGEYPLQMISTHYPRRSHSTLDNVRQLRRAFPEEMWINELDAEARGIKTGDTVLVRSKHGKVLRPAYVTNRILPGVVDIGQGAWVEYDEATGIDTAGCTNMISGTNPSGQGIQSWNTNIVQVEKWTGKPLENDYKWPQRIIFPAGGVKNG